MSKTRTEVDTAAFEKDLERYINSLLPEGLERGLKHACIAIEAQAKTNCPVDDGQLRASITHEVMRDSKGVSGYVGSGVEYAPYVHQGTGIYAVNGDGRQTPWGYEDAEGVFHMTKGQKPQPFLQDAVDKNRKQITKLIEEGLK